MQIQAPELANCKHQYKYLRTSGKSCIADPASNSDIISKRLPKPPQTPNGSINPTHPARFFWCCPLFVRTCIYSILHWLDFLAQNRYIHTLSLEYSERSGHLFCLPVFETTPNKQQKKRRSPEEPYDDAETNVRREQSSSWSFFEPVEKWQGLPSLQQFPNSTRHEHDCTPLSRACSPVVQASSASAGACAAGAVLLLLGSNQALSL